MLATFAEIFIFLGCFVWIFVPRIFLASLRRLLSPLLFLCKNWIYIDNVVHNMQPHTVTVIHMYDKLFYRHYLVELILFTGTVLVSISILNSSLTTLHITHGNSSHCRVPGPSKEKCNNRVLFDFTWHSFLLPS